MLSKKDFEKLKEKLVTKDFLTKTVDELIEYINVMNESTKKEIITELTNVIKGFAKEVSSVLTNHEGRIRVLEKHSDLN